MDAANARKAASDWLEKATKENQEWNRKRIAKETREAETLWKKRGPVLVAQIDSYIRKASSNGHHEIYEPSKLNPNGDSIIWLEESDGPIHEILIGHYRKQGFTVKEFTPIALKIEW